MYLQNSTTVKEQMLYVFTDVFPQLDEAQSLPVLVFVKYGEANSYEDIFGWVWFPENMDIIITYDGDGMFGVAPRSEWKGKLVIPPREAVGRIGSVKAEVRYNYQLMLDSSSKDEVYTIED